SRMTITRRIFLGAAGAATMGTAVAAAGCSPRDVSPTPYVPIPDANDVDEEFIEILARLNDADVLKDAAAADEFVASRPAARSTARALKQVCAAFLCPDSTYHDSDQLVGSATALTDYLDSVRTPSGMYDS